MGDNALDQPLTVVLPMFNRERMMRAAVMEILDLSPVLRTAIEVVVVDDGSTDETYETACELAREYPQVTVYRQPARQGLGAALDLVRRRLNVEMVVVHDGVSPVEASQLKAAVESNPQSEGVLRQSVRRSAPPVDSDGSRHFGTIRALHDRMEHVHRAVTGFYWLQLDKPMIPRRCATSFVASAGNSQGYLTALPSAGSSPAL